MFQAVILWGVLAGCLMAGLLAGLARKRVRVVQAGPDDLGGVHELRAAPVPTVPTTGARVAPAEPIPAPVFHAPEPVEMPVAARRRMNNSSARFGGSPAGRVGARGPAMPTRS